MSNRKSPPKVEGDGARTVVDDEWGPLKTELRRGDPRTLKGQTINARFMTKEQIELLAANMKRDATLTSLPLTYQAPGMNHEEILSGHHRVEAAIAAGFAEIDWLCVVTPLTEQRKVALQLSHNAITGQDDPAILAAMYAGLDLNAKTYSGLDDSALEAMKDVELAGVPLGVKYQEMHLFFLAEDAEVSAAVLKDLETAGRNNRGLAARYSDFDEFFELVVRAKTKFAAFNSALAFRMLIDLARAKLDEMEAEDGEH